MVLEKINKINIVSEREHVRKKNDEEEINDFLDAINIEKKFISKLNILFTELQNEMFETVNNEPSEFFINKDYLQTIIDNTYIYINKIKTSLIYAGVKTKLSELVEIIGLVDEIKSDVVYRNEISKNESPPKSIFTDKNIGLK